MKPEAAAFRSLAPRHPAHRSTPRPRRHGIGPSTSPRRARPPSPNSTPPSTTSAPAFHWHPGLLIDGATLQVPFLADLVTLADPGQPLDVPQYLKTRERLFPSTSPSASTSGAPSTTPYCRWVSENLPRTPPLPPGRRRPLEPRTQPVRGRLHPARHRREAEALGRTYTRNIAIGVGTEPYVPEPLKPLADAPHRARHPLRRLPRPPRPPPRRRPRHRHRLGTVGRRDLPRPAPRPPRGTTRRSTGSPAPRRSHPWSTASSASNTSPPDYTHYFHQLPESERDHLSPPSGSSARASTPTPSPPSTKSSTGALCTAAGPTPPPRRRRPHRGTRRHHQDRTPSGAPPPGHPLPAHHRRRRPRHRLQGAPLGRMLAGLDPYLCRDSAKRPRIDEQFRLRPRQQRPGRRLRTERRAPHPRRRRPRPRTRRLAQRHHPQHPHRQGPYPSPGAPPSPPSASLDTKTAAPGPDSTRQESAANSSGSSTERESATRPAPPPRRWPRGS